MITRLTHEFDPWQWPTSSTYVNYPREWPMRLTCSTRFMTILILVYFVHVEYSILRCFEYSFCQINWLEFLLSFLPLFFTLRRKQKENLTKYIHLFADPIITSSEKVVFCKKGLLTKLAKSTRKYFCWSLGFNEVADLRKKSKKKKHFWH